MTEAEAGYERLKLSLLTIRRLYTLSQFVKQTKAKDFIFSVQKAQRALEEAIEVYVYGNAK